MATPVPAEAVRLRTADGLTLEGEVRLPAGAWAAAVLAHPHPAYGGDMRALVTGVLFDALPAAGVAALRFNFRGVGRSEGTHGDGTGERDDVVAAIDTLHPLVEGLPLVLAGWSFGADVSLAVGDARHHGWLGIAPPLRIVPPEEMAAGPDPRPTVLAVPQFDQFRAPDAVAELTAGWSSTRLEVVPGADHFMAGRTDRVAAIAIELLEHLAGR